MRGYRSFDRSQRVAPRNSRDPRNFREGRCKFCTGDPDNASHERHQCPMFKRLKANASRASYADVRLHPNDNDGFAAAGFCLFTREEGHVEILMAREERNSEHLLNFLGGKRVVHTETPIEVALRTVQYETGNQLSQEILSKMAQPFLVFFSAGSKYVLFFFEITKESIILHGNEEDRIVGEKVLHWRVLDTTNLSDLHEFAANMMRELSRPSFNVLGRIGEIFDATKTTEEEEEEDPIDKVSGVLRQIRLDP